MAKKIVNKELLEMLESTVPGYSITRSDKTGQLQIMCLTCGRVSSNPNDVAEKYCGYCHVFHENRARFRAQ